MKVKTLRFKDTKEFVHILEDGIMGTCEIPYMLPMTASIDALKDYFDAFDPEKEIDYDKLEVIECEVIESGVIGSDICNKLNPMSNINSFLK